MLNLLYTVIVFLKRKCMKRVPGYILQVSREQVAPLSLTARKTCKTMEKRYREETNMKKNAWKLPHVILI